jgi:hypothetical protein
MKLSSFQGNNNLLITKSPHGESQGNCAFDFGFGNTGGVLDKKIYAPCDGTVYTFITQKDGDTYFNFSSLDYGEGNNFYIQFVHDKPIRMGGFKKGELLGEWNGVTAEPHHHVALYFNGWRWIFDALDRNTKLSFWNFGDTSNKWAQWSTYPTDIQLSGDEVPPTIDQHEIIIADLVSQIEILKSQITAKDLELVENKKTISEKVVEINNLGLDIKHLQEVIMNLEIGNQNKTYSWSEILNLILKKLSGKI